MTDALTDAQREELGAALAALEAELEAALARSREAGRPVTLDQTAVGRVSRGDALQQQQMALATARNARVRLSQVKRALAALAGADYGLCMECEEPIAYRRLRSRPETPWCLRCQSEHEAR